MPGPGGPSPDSGLPPPDGASQSAGEAIRTTFFRQHLFAARYFADEARDLEGRAAEPLDDGAICRHGACVTGAILASVAFLEASINELYLEIQDLGQDDDRRMPRRELALLARFWPEIVRSPILHKYQVALSVTDAERFHEGRSPYLDADSLVRLRDALLNYKPEWDDRRGRHRTLEQRLRTRFAPNALARESAHWFPSRCFGAGCAAWAIRVARRFSDEFCQRMAIPARAVELCDGRTPQAPQAPGAPSRLAPDASR